MIAPLVEEDEWIDTLQDIPRWYPTRRRTVVIAPHPDDETLGAGGLIAEQRRLQVPVDVICVTDGEAAYPDTPGLAGIRISEQDLALRALGVPSESIFRLHLPDSRLSLYEAKLAELLTTFIQPDTLVLAPWVHDWHPDHEVCGRAAQRICFATGAELVFYVFWTWHQVTPERLVSATLGRFELDSQILLQKQTALDHHRSQLHRENGFPILPEALLKPARRRFETFVLHE